jgi:predicted TIM-barrel fold metal-dependent hydrolase
MSVTSPPMSVPPIPASKPRHRAPANSTDCHFHIYGPVERYPLSEGRGYTPPPIANIKTYLEMANTLGIERMVIVNPTPYGTDHRCTADTIEQFGRQRAKAVAVVDESFTESDLRDLAKKGFCAARVNSVNTNSTPVSKLQTIVKMIEPLGWHLELYVEGKELPGLERTLLSLPMPVVIDHMGRIPTDQGIDNPEFQTLLRLLSTGKVWIKLCGYRSSVQGPPYADLLESAQTIIKVAPDRCIWGTDWPHPRREGPLLPDDGKLLDLLYDWAPDPKQLHRILVDNPAKLYGFGS